MKCSCERYRFADVVEGADPGYDAFDAHAETGMRNRPVPAQIQVPLEGFKRKLVGLDAALEQFVARDALRSADDFAVTLWRKNIYAERVFWVFGVGLHVEGLDRGRIAVDHDGPVELRTEPGLVRRAEIIAIFKRVFEFAVLVCLVQHGRRLVVAQAREWRQDALELFGIAADDGKFS